MKLQSGFHCYNFQSSTILAINLYALKLLTLPKLRKKKRKTEGKKKENLGSWIIEKWATLTQGSPCNFSSQTLNNIAKIISVAWHFQKRME